MILHIFFFIFIGCRDINECENSPCNATMVCVNTPGSFKCLDLDCTHGRCTSQFVCSSDSDCPYPFACKLGYCVTHCSENSQLCTTVHQHNNSK